MDLHTWLDLPENKGRALWLSDQLNRSKAAVSLWRTEGVPMVLIPRIVQLCPGVTAEAVLAHAIACKEKAAELRLRAPAENRAAA